MIRILLLLSFSLIALGQTSLQHGTGAPSAGNCNTARMYGRVYIDVSVAPPVTYTCGSSGWVTGAGALPAGPTNSLQCNAGGGLFCGSGFSWTLGGLDVYPGTATAGMYNDLTASGAYTDTNSPGAVFTVFIDNQGTPDQFVWCKNLVCSGDVDITGSSQLLSDGVSITFTNTTGHAGENWAIFTGEASFPPKITLPINYSSIYFGEIPSLVLEAPVGQPAVLRMEGTAGSAWVQESTANFSDPANVWTFYSHRGTIDTPTDSQNGDKLGTVYFAGRNAGAMAEFARIYATTTNVPGVLGSLHMLVSGAEAVLSATGLAVPTVNIQNSSFTFNGLTCTVVAGAIVCS